MPRQSTAPEGNMASVEIEMVRNKTGYRRALKRLAWFFDHPPKTGSAEEVEFE
jgi:antitoxin component HigA of HigAB toxin-antitoxin module